MDVREMFWLGFRGSMGRPAILWLQRPVHGMPGGVELPAMDVPDQDLIERKKLGPLGKAGRFCIHVIVAIYRLTLRPFMGGACRYQPTCSQYMLDAVDKHGPLSGGWRGVKRICRCNPWGGFGYDPA
jgi:uncharacterized protein